MNKRLVEKIDTALDLAKAESKTKDSFPFLPEIIESLENFKLSVDSKHTERKKMSSALGRLVTEDYYFSESHLGELIIEICDEFEELN